MKKDCDPNAREGVLSQQKYALRSARDTLIDRFPVPLGSSFPLADLLVCPEKSIVSYGEPGRIKIYFAPQDCGYEFYDAATNEMVTGTTTIKGDELTFETPPLIKDYYTFHVVAVKKLSGLRKQLLQAVNFRIGININLPVLLKDTSPGFSYGSTAVIIIKNVQGGCVYEVLDADNHPLSGQQEKGGGADLEITTYPLLEDKVIHIKVTNTRIEESAELTQQLTLNVYPDTGILPGVHDPVTVYGGSTTITLDKTQQSASYQLAVFSIDDDSVSAESIRQGVLLGPPVPGTGGLLDIPAPALQEDTVVKVIAVKAVTGLSRELPATVPIRVRPDAGKALSVVEDAVQKGDGATVKVAATQRGVMYQLRDDTGNIGDPVYHHKNRGIDKAMVGVDFVVDPFTGDAVYLPTGSLQQTTTFSVLAIKATTRLNAVLVNKVTVPIT